MNWEKILLVVCSAGFVLIMIIAGILYDRGKLSHQSSLGIIILCGVMIYLIYRIVKFK